MSKENLVKTTENGVVVISISDEMIDGIMASALKDICKTEKINWG